MTRRPAILLVANWDSGVGYAWWLMESFWAALAKRYRPTHRVLLAYPSISGIPGQIKAALIEPVTLDMREPGLAAVWRQCRFLRRHGVRLIYFSDWGTWRFRYLAYRLAGVRKIIIHDHTPGLRTVPTGPKRWLKGLVNRAPWLAADGALGATEFVRRRLVEVSRFPADRSFAVGNGLPECQPGGPWSREGLGRQLGIPADRVVLVMAARAHRYKGVDFAIRCLARSLQHAQQPVQFLFIGDGPELDHFRAVAVELEVESHCTFTGRRDDVNELLPACDIAIHPSQGEVGYSLSILEYMRAALPVIVPDNPSVCGATEHGETGLVYPEGDLEAGARAIARLARDPDLRRRMGARGREAVTRRYRLEHSHAALLKAFAKLDPRFAVE